MNQSQQMNESLGIDIQDERTTPKQLASIMAVLRDNNIEGLLDVVGTESTLLIIGDVGDVKKARVELGKALQLKNLGVRNLPRMKKAMLEVPT